MSRFIFAGNEIIPGTVVMTADGIITPKDDLRVILNISGGGTVSLSDGTDTTQRIEIVNVNADSCSFTYKGTGGSTTASIYTNTGIRLLWVGSYWETSMSTAVTGIDDNNQPFAFNIDSLVKPDGVINLTGTDANGNPFDYGLGKLVTVADEDNIVTGVEIKTSKTYNGKPVYEMVISGAPTVNTGTYRTQYYYDYTIPNANIIKADGYYDAVRSGTPLRNAILSASFTNSGAGNPQYVGSIGMTNGVVSPVISTIVGWFDSFSTIVCFVSYTKTTD